MPTYLPVKATTVILAQAGIHSSTAFKFHAYSSQPTGFPSARE